MNKVVLPVSRASLLKKDWNLILLWIICLIATIIYTIANGYGLWFVFVVVGGVFGATHRLGHGACIPFSYTITDTELFLECYEHKVIERKITLQKEETCAKIIKNDKLHLISLYDKNGLKAFALHSTKWSESSYWSKEDVEALEQALIVHNYQIIRSDSRYK